MRRSLWLLPILFLWHASPQAVAAPSDVVPTSSGLYDALSLLAQERLLPAESLDAADLRGVTHRLYTRAEMAALVGQASDDAADARGRAALTYARNALAPELGRERGAGPTRGGTFGATGYVRPELAGRDDNGSALRDRGYVFGRGRVFGSVGRDGAYTVGVTNDYRDVRDHASFTTRLGGQGGGDNPGVLNGVDEAYATVLGHKGVRLTGGLMRQRWGSGYRGEMLVSDNGPSHPTVEIELPFYLGHTLGRYTFTQYEATYSNGGRTVYQGARRLEHTFGDRVQISLEEAYASNEFKNINVLFTPFFAYQSNEYTNTVEPFKFNYLANIGLTIEPFGPATDARLYGQLVLDDIEAPGRLGKGTSVPRKIGYLLGYAQVFPRSGTDAVLEYAHADRATYTAPAVAELAWFDGDLPQAHPIGPNGKEVFVRLGQRLNPRLHLSVEARDRRRVADDFSAPTSRSLDVGLDYRLGPSRSVGLTLSDYREDPFTGVSNITIPPAGGAAAGERLRRRILALSFLQAF